MAYNHVTLTQLLVLDMAMYATVRLKCCFLVQNEVSRVHTHVQEKDSTWVLTRNRAWIIVQKGFWKPFKISEGNLVQLGLSYVILVLIRIRACNSSSN